MVMAAAYIYGPFDELSLRRIPPSRPQSPARPQMRALNDLHSRLRHRSSLRIALLCSRNAPPPPLCPLIGHSSRNVSIRGSAGIMLSGPPASTRVCCRVRRSYCATPARLKHTLACSSWQWASAARPLSRAGAIHSDGRPH